VRAAPAPFARAAAWPGLASTSEAGRGARWFAIDTSASKTTPIPTPALMKIPGPRGLEGAADDDHGTRQQAVSGQQPVADASAMNNRTDDP
jgi:hypothetical protein